MSALEGEKSMTILGNRERKETKTLISSTFNFSYNASNVYFFLSLMGHRRNNTFKCFHFSSIFSKLFSSPEHEVLRVSYCDHSPSVVQSHFLVYTLASTNINQPGANFVQMYMAIRSRMSLIVEVIGSELSELSALELENLPYLTLFTL